MVIAINVSARSGPAGRGELKGKTEDTGDNPLTGAHITLKNTDRATITGAGGSFELIGI